MPYLYLLLLVSMSVLATASAFGEGQLNQIVRPITTTVSFDDGGLQMNRGNGFVIGHRFYTAYHNIQSPAGNIVHQHTEIGGFRVQPLAVDAEHDLAVFELPPDLCRSWCNGRQFASSVAAQQVTWLQPVDGDREISVWRYGNVSNLAFKSQGEDESLAECERNVVVEVDEPFYPGSSGGPVFDARSGAIVGLIQGSFEREDGESTGYYKPVECLLARLGTSPS
jgi:S1-C subfamily serine protease